MMESCSQSCHSLGNARTNSVLRGGVFGAGLEKQMRVHQGSQQEGENGVEGGSLDFILGPRGMVYPSMVALLVPLPHRAPWWLRDSVFSWLPGLTFAMPPCPSHTFKGLLP